MTIVPKSPFFMRSEYLSEPQKRIENFLVIFFGRDGQRVKTPCWVDVAAREDKERRE